jgi:hypothetical protein
MVSSIFNSLGSLIGGGSYGRVVSREMARLQIYGRYKRMYDGFALRRTSARTEQWKKLRYNIARPIADKITDFLAAKPIQWVIKDNDDAQEAAEAIWERSGGGAAFLENAGLGVLYGDSCVQLARNKSDEVILRWLDPSLTFPEFNRRDLAVVDGLVIAYEVPLLEGGFERYYEEWRKGEVQIRIDDQVTETHTYDAARFGGVPAVWIRNNAIKGSFFGVSDLQSIEELVEAYDHHNCKADGIVDYYAHPNIMVKGMTKDKFASMIHGERTIYFIDKEGDMSFLEWKGNAPDLKERLDRMRETISEVAEVPQIVFSKLETGASQVTGIALRIMYGPLISKTNRKRAVWGPQLCKVMQWALVESGFSDVKLTDIDIAWQDPLPTNDRESWETGLDQIAAGVSEEQVQRERGYDDTAIQRMADEKAAKQQQQANLGAELLKNFDQGKNGDGTPAR